MIISERFLVYFMGVDHFSTTTIFLKYYILPLATIKAYCLSFDYFDLNYLNELIERF